MTNKTLYITEGNAERQIANGFKTWDCSSFQVINGGLFNGTWRYTGDTRKPVSEIIRHMKKD